MRALGLGLLSCVLHACAATGGAGPTNPVGGPGTLRVALCQIEVDGDVEAAFGRIEAALDLAAREGAELACFPEACLGGWTNPAAHGIAAPVPGAWTDRLGGLARSYGVALVCGLAETGDGGALHNAAVLIGDDGAVWLHHRKVNVLTELMERPYVPGDAERASVADTPLGRVGLLICADTFEDGVVAALAAEHPDLVVVPYGWAAEPNAWPQHAGSLHGWIARTAERTGAPVVGVDSVGTLRWGPWDGFVLGGQSAVAGSDGVLGAVLADRGAEVRVVDLPYPPRARGLRPASSRQ